MIETAIVAISRRGAEMGYRLLEALGGEATLYVEQRFAGGPSSGVESFELPLSPLIGRAFDEYARLVLFMPVGAAVRLLAPYIGSKQTDPAVVCVDDAGRFAVSLLSGHTGGADAFAEEIAEVLGAAPVITSASHALGTLAVDMLGKEYGWRMEANPTDVTRASAAVVNGEPVAIYQDAGEKGWWPFDKRPLPDNLRVFDSLEALVEYPASTALVITDRALSRTSLGDRTMILYYPRSLVVGIGCRKGVAVEELEQLIYQTFTSHGLATSSIRCLATAEVKRGEPALAELAERLDASVSYYSAGALNSRPGPSGPSAAYEHLGVVGVSEPAALLASGNDSLVVSRVKSAAATIAVARMEFSD